MTELTAVSGATGFIGSAVVRRLLEAGRAVRALVEPSSNTKALAGLDIELLEVDVCDHEKMFDALTGCAAYYHLAAVYKVWTPDPSNIYRVNLEGTAASMLAAQRAEVPRIVYTSSIAAVGLRDDGRPSDENVPFNLYDIANDYVLTKHLSERLVHRFAESGMPIVIVNPAFPFGEHDHAPTPTGRIIVQLLKGEVPVTTPGGFCAVDVQDVAAAHLAAEAHGEPGQRYILGNHNVPFKQFASMVCEQAGVAAPRIRVPASIGRVVAAGFENWSKWISQEEPRATVKTIDYMQRGAYFDGAKARRVLGMPCTPLPETIERAIAFFRESGMAT